MPPTTRRLPRRRNARAGELNLEEACEERIDAVTAEPLVAGHFVEVLSPDKTLKLFYNTSTLIRIGVDKGGFMQPPHFREPMDPSMQKRIEQLEGKTFQFAARDDFLFGTVVDGDDHSTAGGVTINHRHVYFDQIVEEFFLLNPAELYVCSLCYDHYVQTRFLPSEAREGHRVAYLEREGEETAIPLLDPLDVLTHMAQPNGENESDCALVHIAFRYAAPWKKHMKIHHGVTGVTSEDYTVRALLCNFYSHFNQWQTNRYERRLQQRGAAKPTPALTQRRYWLNDAGYNRLRYNRLVDTVEPRQGEPRTYEESAFPGEDIAVHANPVAADEDESDFICDDSGSDDGGFNPHYSPSVSEHEEEPEEEEEEEEEEAERHGRRRLRTARLLANPRGTAGARKRRRASTASSSSASTSSSSDADTDDTDSDSGENSVDEGRNVIHTQITAQQKLYKRGLLAEHDRYYERLSAEDRVFLNRESKRMRAPTPSTLYDPRMATLGGIQSDPSLEMPSMDLSDWANIGETLSTPHTLQPSTGKPEGKATLPPPGPQFQTSAMLLDDE